MPDAHCGALPYGGRAAKGVDVRFNTHKITAVTREADGAVKRGGRSLHRDEGRVVTSLLPSASSPAAASARHQRIRRGRAQRACCPGVRLVKSSPRTGPSPAIWWASCKVRLCQLRPSSSQLSHKDLRDASGEPKSVSSTGVSPDNDCGQRSSSASLLPQVLLPQAVRRAPDSVWLRSPMDLLPHGGERARGERESSCLKGFITKPDGATA